MNFFIFGVSHKIATLALREKLAFSAKEISRALLVLNSYDNIIENVIISTCNRVEIYVFADDANCIDKIKLFLANFHEITDDFDGYSYSYQGEDAVRHLFNVVSSLDSMIVGENQILGQVKNAYLTAKSCEVIGKNLSMLFETALKVGKSARSDTNIGKGAVSISMAAIELARKFMGDLEDKTALIVGAGKVGVLTIRNLVAKGVKTICVANRTYQKAISLIDEFNCNAIKFDSLNQSLETVDIVICSTNAPHFTIKKNDVLKTMTDRTKPIFFIDLGVPRNIEPSLSEIENVYLHDIDDLSKVKDENLEKRHGEIEKVKNIIDRTLDSFMKKVVKSSVL